VRVPMRIAHVAALVDEHVIEEIAVPIGMFRNLSQKYPGSARGNGSSWRSWRRFPACRRGATSRATRR
jgi:hypothetical protein